MTLEKDFTLLMASMARSQNSSSPQIVRPSYNAKLTHTRTVYSIGEALTQKGRMTDAQLGRSINRNSGS